VFGLDEYEEKTELHNQKAVMARGTSAKAMLFAR